MAGCREFLKRGADGAKRRGEGNCPREGGRSPGLPGTPEMPTEGDETTEKGNEESTDGDGVDQKEIAVEGEDAKRLDQGHRNQHE